MKRTARVTLRSANVSHAARLHALISANREEGHLLPRSLEEVTRHAERFIVAVRGTRLIACAELAPLSADVAEVRSLVVTAEARGAGIGAQLVEELRKRARQAGFDRLCAFTHCPSYFSHLGFSIVPHLWVPEKISADCVKCPSFRTCGQYAMVVDLDDVREKPVVYPIVVASAVSARVA